MRVAPALLLLAACGGPASGSDEVPVDSTLVAALADLHLADARAALVPDSARTAAFADSLRAAALAAHGLDTARLGDRLAELAADPARTRATYEAVETRLADDRQRLAY